MSRLGRNYLQVGMYTEIFLFTREDSVVVYQIRYRQAVWEVS